MYVRSKPGRPTGRNYTVTINVNCSEKQKRKVHQLAARKGMNVSEFMRGVIDAL